VTLSVQRVTELNPIDPVQPREGTVVVPQASGWITLFHSSENTLAAVPGPGRLKAMLSEEGQIPALVTLDFIGARAEPLTPDRVEAIRSDPSAFRIVRSTSAASYATRNVDVCRVGKTLCSGGGRVDVVRGASDGFDCACGVTKFDFRSFGKPTCLLIGGNQRAGEVSVSKLYEKSTIQEARERLVSYLTIRERE